MRDDRLSAGLLSRLLMTTRGAERNVSLSRQIRGNIAIYRTGDPCPFFIAVVFFVLLELAKSRNSGR